MDSGKFVLKLGGFLFSSKPDLVLINRYVEVIKKLASESLKLVVVTGGGELARTYINIARGLALSESICDELGIYATRLNARLFVHKLGDLCFPEVPTSISELITAFRLKPVVVMGGLTPGQSTDAVAALAAESINAELLIRVLDVDGIYTSDPKKNPDAEKLEEINIDDLLKWALSDRYWAGDYRLIDPVAVKILKRARVNVIYIGKNPENIEKVIKGEKIGTRVIAGS